MCHICEHTGAVTNLNPAGTSAFPIHPLNWNSTQNSNLKLWTFGFFLLAKDLVHDLPDL